MEVASKFQLGMYFSSVSNGSHLTPEFHTIKAKAETSPVVFTLSDRESYNAPFSLRELKGAPHDCKNTAAGPVGIHYHMLKHLSQSALVFLFDMYNKIWSTGEFPPTWREALTLPFLKPDKKAIPHRITDPLY